MFLVGFSVMLNKETRYNLHATGIELKQESFIS